MSCVAVGASERVWLVSAISMDLPADADGWHVNMLTASTQCQLLIRVSAGFDLTKLSPSPGRTYF